MAAPIGPRYDIERIGQAILAGMDPGTRVGYGRYITAFEVGGDGFGMAVVLTGLRFTFVREFPDLGKCWIQADFTNQMLQDALRPENPDRFRAMGVETEQRFKEWHRGEVRRRRDKQQPKAEGQDIERRELN